MHIFELHMRRLDFSDKHVTNGQSLGISTELFMTKSFFAGLLTAESLMAKIINQQSAA
ncbi:MAG: hypothetical protein ACOC0L_01430 [bacterium]